MYLGTLFDVKLYAPLEYKNISQLVVAKRMKSLQLTKMQGISIYRASQITHDELMAFSETLDENNSKKLLEMVNKEQLIVNEELKENINNINKKIEETEMEVIGKNVKDYIEYTYLWWIFGVMAIFIMIALFIF